MIPKKKINLLENIFITTSLKTLKIFSYRSDTDQRIFQYEPHLKHTDTCKVVVSFFGECFPDSIGRQKCRIVFITINKPEFYSPKQLKMWWLQTLQTC